MGGIEPPPLVRVITQTPGKECRPCPVSPPTTTRPLPLPEGAHKIMPDTDPKYPNIHVTLTGGDGNAMAVLATVTKAMRKADVPKDEIDRFVNEATKGNYDELLATAMRWVDVS